MRLRKQPADVAADVPAEPNASDQPHDVLAAEQFAMPAPEAALHGAPIVLPEDPLGTDEPHDVLAAEQFAMPAPSSHAPPASPPAAPRSRKAPIAGLLAAGLGAFALIRRRARRR